MLAQRAWTELTHVVTWILYSAITFMHVLIRPFTYIFMVVNDFRKNVEKLKTNFANILRTIRRISIVKEIFFWLLIGISVARASWIHKQLHGILSVIWFIRMNTFCMCLSLIELPRSIPFPINSAEFII